ncbi:hypothetical protein TD95_000467 [Thielaviopsis punctulata]|uniref:Cystinosin n=1 Tax=Thielaviopsis punctulata TaxID=72032 RepID=A0A0F4ZAQ9_9PEZI|nr:hypothetical protein TD95_000467 [Thielaviopsis punctulata]
MGFLAAISVLFGWVYTTCWSLSFYPQPLLNYQRKSTAGSTIDFPFINTLGFLAYLTSTSFMYYSPLIREQYAARNNGHMPSVAANDVAFAAHAFLASAVILSQYYPRIWGFDRAGATRVSRFIMGTCFGCLLGVVSVALLVAHTATAREAAAAPLEPRRDWCALDMVYAISYVKLVITLVKYAPQVVHNYRARSTRGWSIGGILLDFTGGVLSVAQLCIDSYLVGDWTGITGNPVKLALGNLSMMYDAVFMAQHYVLYAPEKSAQDEDVERRLD